MLASRLDVGIRGVHVGQQQDTCEQDGACAAACAAAQVPWEVVSCGEKSLRQLVQTEDLLVLGQALPAARKQELLREVELYQDLAVLVCSDEGSALTRVLLVDQDDSGKRPEWSTALELCRACRTSLVVLTVARSERAAQIRQQTAIEALSGCGVEVDFDLVVGSEVRTAVAHVARWRRCQLVVMRRHQGRAWWRWLRGRPTELVMEVANSLSFLTLPTGMGVDFPRLRQENEAAFPDRLALPLAPGSQTPTREFSPRVYVHPDVKAVKETVG
jgi:nucleotide-binding universal stress UspA family protein